MSYLRNTTFWYYVVFIVLIAVGIFLRVYNHADYMHFELDQARDAYVISDALASERWPDKGPIARGSDLHLGPMSYWFLLISAQIFGLSLETLAYPDLVFGILGLLLTYLFVRKVFDPFSALGVLALASTSLFLITYSRFAWNPNGLFFWSMLVSLALLGITSSQSRLVLYLSSVVVALSSAVLMQLHFIGFFVIPIVVVGYLIWNRRSIGRSVWFTIIGSFIIFISPVMYTEIASGGVNTSALIATVQDKGTKDDSHSLVEKLFRSGQKTAHFFALSHIGYQGGGGSIRLDLNASQIFSCNDSCKERLVYSIFSLILFGFAIIVLGVNLRQKDRLLVSLTILWTVGCAIFLSVLAYQISPRFYLFVMPVFILLWGALIAWFRDRLGAVFVSCVLIILFCVNLSFVYRDFLVSQRSLTQSIDAPRDSILGRGDRVVLGALRRAATFVDESSAVVDAPFIIVADNRYARALHYLLDVELDNSFLLCYTKRSDLSEGYDTLPIWLLVREGSGDHVPAALQNSHRIGKNQNFGTITLSELLPIQEVSRQQENFSPGGCHVR